MMLRIKQDDKFHAFLKVMGLRPLATQAPTQVVERSQGLIASEGSVLWVVYQETRILMTFSTRDLANRAVNGEKPLYVTSFLGAS